jgi:hypothetical protein
MYDIQHCFNCRDNEHLDWKIKRKICQHIYLDICLPFDLLFFMIVRKCHFLYNIFFLLLRHTKTSILVCGDIPIQVYSMAIRAEKTTAGSRATFRITARVAPAGGTQGFPPIGEQRGSAVQGHSANRSKPIAGIVA